jgi:D-amino-acid dehydrogenase
MKIVVIGSGLIGVTTAYLLRRKGHDVDVIERAEGPARETSFANGAMLTSGMAEPWNAPGVWRVLIGSLGRSDAALKLHLRALPSLVRWGLAFLRNSTSESVERNALSILRLAVYSRTVMESLRRDTNIEYGRATRGSLSIFRDEDALNDAIEVARRRSFAGLRFRRLSIPGMIELEPALSPIADQLVGAIHYETDETGDAYRFCEALAERARQEGVRFRFGTEVAALEAGSGRIVAAVGSDKTRFTADHYVVAAGSFSTLLLKRVGVDLPVQPAKGYSVTFDDRRDRPSLRMPIIDSHLHAVVVPLEGAVRLAGMAEFAGYDRRLDPVRIRSLLKLLPAVLPRAPLDRATAKAWCGLRPSSADGVAIIGRTPIANLWINSGQGHLGWTTAAGSAQLLASLLSGDPAAIDPKPYELSRFSAAA